MSATTSRFVLRRFYVPDGDADPIPTRELFAGVGWSDVRWTTSPDAATAWPSLEAAQAFGREFTSEFTRRAGWDVRAEPHPDNQEAAMAETLTSALGHAIEHRDGKTIARDKLGSARFTLPGTHGAELVDAVAELLRTASTVAHQRGRESIASEMRRLLGAASVGAP